MSISKNSPALPWIIGTLLIASIIATAFFVFTSNNKSTNSVSTSQTSASQPEESSTPAQPSSSTGTTIKTGNSEYGPMLFDSRGQAIYIFELEESSKAECYGSCAKSWPPVLTDGDPVASGNVDAKLLGTTKRTDGTTQVTYNGHPLYFYANEKPGEVECHNIKTHGGLWWVIQPNGTRAP